MIRFVKGNLFDSTAEALVNAVNCVGVMGKGIALQFKHRFPLMYLDYRNKCHREEILLGQVSLFRENGRIIINFPTKGHWRSDSYLKNIVSGLQSLHEAIRVKKIRSIAIPPLGCGNGGLQWSRVMAVLKSCLSDLDDVDIEIYMPAQKRE